MVRQPYQLIGQCYKNDYLRAGDQNCINWIQKDGAILNTPGLTSWTTVGDGQIRGMLSRGDDLIVVSDNDVYKIDKTKSATSLGAVNTTDSRVSMAYDGDSVVIVDGKDGWRYDGTTFEVIGDQDFPNKPSFVAFADGYFIVNDDGTGRFYKSEYPFNSSAWGGEFATAEQNPDNIISLIEHRSDLWLYGEKSTEVWYYSGAASFPWDPRRDAFFDYGICAPHSASKFDNGLAWLACSNEIDRVAVRTRGFQVSRISTTPIEREWANYSKVDDAFSFSYQYPGLGHFWVLTFPTANKTWCFDAQTGLWFEWERYDPPLHGRHLSNCYAYFDGNHLVGDYNSNNIYSLDPDVYTDNGTEIRREIIGPELKTNRERVFYHSFEAELHAGKGLATGQGQNPIMYLQYSNNRGTTWSNPKQMTMGRAGGYLTRCRATRLGSARSRMFKIYTSEPIETTLTNATVDIEKGSN